SRLPTRGCASSTERSRRDDMIRIILLLAALLLPSAARADDRPLPVPSRGSVCPAGFSFSPTSSGDQGAGCTEAGSRAVPARLARGHAVVLRPRATLKRSRGHIGCPLAPRDPIQRPCPLPRGFVPPCLPTKAPQPPSGDAWLHEIKHDGFRVIARKDGDRVRLYSRPGNDLTIASR